MKQMGGVVFLLTLGFASSASAQMGMDLLKKPAFTKAFHPVVGQGAAYESASKRGPNGKTSKMDMGIVGKDSVDGKEAYWMQTMIQLDNGQSMLSKMLMTAGDLQPSRVITQMPGRPAMEMPVNMTAANRDKMSSSMQDWHSVGGEIITVPAGTFSCEHWKNENTGGEVWTSDKVTPSGLVKEVSKDGSMTLLKVLSEYPDRITGPVQKFDPQMMMQQEMQRRQQPQP
jgi:hypothetical protein